ncbi:MAG: hypothetical protein AAFU61_14650 [Pseudomonadota bacterium]
MPEELNASFEAFRAQAAATWDWFLNFASSPPGALTALAVFVAAVIGRTVVLDIWQRLVARVGALIRSPETRLRADLRRHLLRNRPKGAPLLRIALFGLLQDGDGGQLRHVIRSINRAVEGGGLDLDPHVVPCALRTGEGSEREDEARADRLALWFLDRASAQIAILGEVRKKDEAVRLRFVQRDGSEERHHNLGLSDDGDLILSADFDERLGPVIVGRALSQLRPECINAGRYVADLIGPAADLTAPLAETPLPNLPARDQARIHETLAIMRGRQGEQTGDAAKLEAAVSNARRAVALCGRDEDAAFWARATVHLGTALQTLGEREPGTARLEEAVAAFRDALRERTRDRVPLDWAITQNNLGTAEEAFFDKTGDAAHLDRAAAHFEDARDVFAEAGAGAYVQDVDRNLARLRAERSGD